MRVTSSIVSELGPQEAQDCTYVLNTHIVSTIHEAR